MLSWEETVSLYIEKYQDLIRKTTEPLRHHFGVTYFTYHHVQQNGHYSVLLDRPDFAAHYVQNELFKVDPFLRHPRFFKSGFFAMSEFFPGSTRYLLDQEYADFFNTEPGFIYIDKQTDGVDFFGLVGAFTKEEVFNLYVKNAGVLKRFCHFFKKEMAGILKKMKLDPIFLTYLNSNFENEVLSIKDLQNMDFLKKIGYERELLSFSSLSKREVECLRLLLLNKTAKEIGISLDLSRRTVEAYLESAKDKLNCFSKSTLIQKALLFSDFGLF